MDHEPSRFVSPHIGHIDQSGANMDADLMDEKRKEHIAYEYLCHLEEAKKWIEACIEEEIPQSTELEEALRNGVILCKLGHYYAPEVVPLRRIYDIQETKYRAKGLHFKHTDNFNFWLNTLRKVGLPKIFYPITTDLYDRKNMPRVIYCIHALSLYLHKLGKAPQIEDLLGTATFTEEEISLMKMELDKYGINMPSFGKIGGILTNQMSVDEAAVHAAIMAVNKALEKDDPAVTLAALRNPMTCLAAVEEESSERYHSLLYQAKKDKSARSQNGSVDESERDVYEYLLTKTEIQGGLNTVNSAVTKQKAEARMQKAVSGVNAAIASGSKTALLRALQAEDARLQNVLPQNMQWYLDILAKAVKDKTEAEGSAELGHDEIQDIVNIANEIAVNTRLVEAAVMAVNRALEQGDEEQTLQVLQNEQLDLSDVYPLNKSYYHSGLLARRSAKAETAGGSVAAALLTEDDIQQEVSEANDRAQQDLQVSQAVSGINSCLSEGSDPVLTLQALQNQFAGLGFIDESVGERYHVALQNARTEKGEDLTQDEIRKVVEDVNEEVRLERLRAEGMVGINAALVGVDPSDLLDQLQNQYVGLEGVQEEQALHYLHLMQAAQAAKAERTGNPDAQLSRAEIQSAIERANTQTVEAIQLAQSVCAINSAVESGNAPTTLEALKSPAAGLRSITDECADTYHLKLTESQAEKETGTGLLLV